MKDRRFVDDLSVEDLERILLVKRREERLARVRQMDCSDRVVGRDPLEPAIPSSGLPPIPTTHRQFQGMGASASYRSVEVEDGRQWPFRSRLAGRLSTPLNIDWRFVVSTILVLVEVTAVVGLVVIVVSTWHNREKISEGAEDLFVVPNPTSTTVPRINAVVLPGGHTPPDARGVSQPEPIPERLRTLAEVIEPQPIPTQGPQHATRIVIPSLGIDHPVALDDDWEALKRGVGHAPWSADPGEVGNCVLSAHNDIFGEIFRKLPEMELGDEIFVYTSTQIYRYVVKATRVVEPTQVEMMYATDHPVLTLISSYPYLVDNARIVVIAELDQ